MVIDLLQLQAYEGSRYFILNTVGMTEKCSALPAGGTTTPPWTAACANPRHAVAIYSLEIPSCPKDKYMSFIRRILRGCMLGLKLCSPWYVHGWCRQGIWLFDVPVYILKGVMTRSMVDALSGLCFSFLKGGSSAFIAAIASDVFPKDDYLPLAELV